MIQHQHSIALGCFALFIACTPASAQSVQLSGQLGAGAGFRSHQGAGNGTVYEVTDNLIWASWLRFGGVEDLGAGMRAMFRLEAGLNMDTGTSPVAAKFWNRQSWVALQMGDAGVVSLGRQFPAAIDRAVRTLGVNNQAGLAAVVPMGLLAVNRYNGLDSRTDNSVKYRYSLPGVIEVGANLSAGEGTMGRNYSADIAQTTERYDVGLMYEHYDANARLPSGAMPVSTFWAIGGNATFGNLRPYIAYYRGSLDSTSPSGSQQGNRVLCVSLAWQPLPQWRFTADEYHDKATNLNGVPGRDGAKDTTVLTAFYYFSKRTELYLAAHSNRYSDGYRLDPVNIAVLNRNPNASAVSGLSLGISNRF